MPALKSRSLFSTYISLDRRHALAADHDLPDRTEGAVVLADIAGFTPLADALASSLGPHRGVEELTQLLNDVYDVLIAQVHRYRGSVVSFVGDGLVCWFEGDAGLQAVACGLGMQEAVASCADAPTPDGGTASLSMKAGVAAGPARRFLVGRPYVDLLAGATLNRVAQGEQAARQGEIVGAPEIVQMLGDRLNLIEERNGFAVVAGLTERVSPAPWPERDLSALTLEQMQPYLLSPVYERLAAGQGEFLAELRPAAALFLRFEGLDYEQDNAGSQLDAFVRWVQEILARYEGHLLQLTAGDKGSFLYAAIGALRAHEDDAERAVRAAMALRQPPPEMDFITGVQIGLSQGRVRAGAYGGRSRRTYGAIGPEAIVACRLMEVAPAGEVWCSPAMYEAASGRWAFEPLEPVALRGKADPLPVYRPAQQVGGRTTQARGVLIGRQAEVETLARMLAEAQSGQRRALLLEGKAGIGKSRLLTELRQLAQQRGVAWMEGAGQSIEQGTPYRAWRDVLTDYFDLDQHMDQAERQRRVQERVTGVNPTLAQRVPLLNDILLLGLPESDLTWGFDPKLRHESLTTLVIDLLRAKVADGSLVLVLEDGHWLDSLSWELALSVARAFPAPPDGGGTRGGLLLVLALRPLEEPAPTEYTSLAALENTEILRLDALRPEEAVALAAARLGAASEALPVEVAALVEERAGGNPFFAEELAHVLRDSGTVVTKDGDCTLTGDLATMRERVPDTVEGLVLARIDRLPPEQQLTLKVAAVIGRSFLYRTLYDVHPRRIVTDLLQAQLDDLERQDLALVEALEPELSYLFKHVITQQVAYDTLLFAQRRKLHRAVARWYGRVYDDLSPYYPLLVHHWHRAEDTEQERRYARLAGEQSAAQYANAEAVRYLSRALELTPEEDTPQWIAERYALLMAREKVYAIQGEWDARAQDLGSLKELSNHLTVDQQARIALRQAKHARETGDYAAAIATAQAAIELAQTGQEADAAPEGHLIWGQALLRQGEYGLARSQCEQALTLAQAGQLHRLEANCLNNLGVIFGNMGDYARAQVHYERALQIFYDIDDPRGQSAPLNNLGVLSNEQGDNAAARAYYQQALDIHQETGNRRGEGMVLGNLGLVAAAQGQYVEAKSYHRRSLVIAREIGHQYFEGNALINLGDDSLHLGDYESARDEFESALRVCRQIGYRTGESWALSGLSLLSHRLGDDESALTYGKQAERTLQETQTRHIQGYVSTHLGHALAGLNRLPEAADAYRQALALRRDMGQAHLAAETAAGLAGIYLAQGRLTQALAQVEEILDHLETDTLDGTEEPFQIYLTCYQILETNEDLRAREILNMAYDLLRERAARIKDEELRRSFLENVAAHREIVQAWEGAG